MRAPPICLRPPDPHLKASVLIITYNVEPFITEALESVLMQEVDFNYEIVIGEDFSTDRTQGIVIGMGKNTRIESA